MEQIYLIAKKLANDAKHIEKDLFAFNPAFENNKHKSLSSIIIDINSLVLDFIKLKIKIYDKNSI